MVGSVARPGVGSTAERELSLVDPGVAVMGTSADLVSELTACLANLDLGDARLAKVVTLLQASHGKEAPPETKETSMPQPPHRQEHAVDTGAGLPGPAAEQKTIRLLVAEEQEILKEAYRSSLGTHPSIEMVGCFGGTSAESLVDAASALQANVILLGVKALRPSTVETLETLRDACPGMGLVLLSAFHHAQGIKVLRAFSAGATTGYAYLFKHNIDTAEQLAQVVHSVAQGRVIVDPLILEDLVENTYDESNVVMALSPNELQVLSWMAKGYGNRAIAGVLSRDNKAVGRQINNIYGKLEINGEGIDRRVGAALMYLRATGLLPRG